MNIDTYEKKIINKTFWTLIASTVITVASNPSIISKIISSILNSYIPHKFSAPEWTEVYLSFIMIFLPPAVVYTYLKLNQIIESFKSPSNVRTERLISKKQHFNGISRVMDVYSKNGGLSDDTIIDSSDLRFTKFSNDIRKDYFIKLCKLTYDSQSNNSVSIVINMHFDNDEQYIEELSERYRLLLEATDNKSPKKLIKSFISTRPPYTDRIVIGDSTFEIHKSPKEDEPDLFIHIKKDRVYARSRRDLYKEYIERTELPEELQLKAWETAKQQYNKEKSAAPKSRRG